MAKIPCKWVDSLGNVKKSRMYINTIDFDTNSVPSIYVSNCPDIGTLNQAVVNNSGGKCKGISYGDTMQEHADFVVKEVGLIQNFAKFYPVNGDKLIFETGSYIEFICNKVVVSGIEERYDITMRYYTSNGTLVYNTTVSVAWWAIGRDNINMKNTVVSIPWIPTNPTSYKAYGLYVYGYDKTSMGVHVQYMDAQLVTFNPSSVSNAIGFFNGIEPVDPDDPYPDVPDSDDDDPDPDGPPDDEPVPFPDIPDIEVTETGFINLYAPTKAQLVELASYMWSGLFDVGGFRKIFADPMDCILGLNVLPFSVSRGGLSPVKVGNISTGVNMYEATSQYKIIDCGTVNLGKITDTYLDFAPYSKYYIYLPFIGIQELSADDVAHKSLHVVYHIDILSCACVAYIKCGESVLYQFTGSCGMEVPITSDSFTQAVGHIISIAGTTGALVASGGASAPLTVAGGASLAGNVMGLKPDVKRSGSIGSSAGMLGVQKPYIIIEAPNICKPSRQHHYIGYPSFVTKSVGSVSGYVEFDSVIVDGVPCTDAERDMISEILKGGIYV